MSEVIALAGWPPEVLAYAFAKYSRSALSIKESIAEISADKSAKFLETFYFQYGHRSIADNAHIPLAFEDISDIAAFQLEDEQLWDGQQQSTRYQNFNRPGAYMIPSSIKGTPFESDYVHLADAMMTNYSDYSRQCFEWLVKNNPRPADTKQDNYERTLRARAFDIARYWLFGGVITNVGQITNARSLESQLSRLLASEYQEVRELAEKAKQACMAAPFCPPGKDEPPIGPTLVKYVSPNQYILALRELMQRELKIFDSPETSWGNSPIKRFRYVEMTSLNNDKTEILMLDEILATMIYEATQYSYQEILNYVSVVLPIDYKRKLMENILSLRGQKDQLPKAFAAGYKFQYEIAMDRGGARDLHRHRNCIQTHQGLTLNRGWETPRPLRKMGLVGKYDVAMCEIGIQILTLKKLMMDRGGDQNAVDTNYLIPFGFITSSVYKMDLRQANYMSELRSGVMGHFSYREIACKMHELMLEHFPDMANFSRVTPFEQEDLLKR